MNKEQQDKLWNELSEEDKDKFQFWYVENKSIDPSSEFIKGKLYEAELIFGSHNLNPKPLTYEDVVSKTYKGGYNITLPCNDVEHSAKIDAINKLIIVAKYLNGDWKPDFGNIDENKWIYNLNHKEGIMVVNVQYYNSSIVYFRTKELAEQAIQILGEETIRLALSTNY